MILRIITCSGTAEVEGAGASQMQSGIPHLHSLMPDTSVFSAVGMDFESTFELMSNLVIVSVTLFTPSEDVCGASFPDLFQREDVNNF